MLQQLLLFSRGSDLVGISAVLSLWDSSQPRTNDLTQTALSTVQTHVGCLLDFNSAGEEKKREEINWRGFRTVLPFSKGQHDLLKRSLKKIEMYGYKMRELQIYYLWSSLPLSHLRLKKSFKFYFKLWNTVKLIYFLCTVFSITLKSCLGSQEMMDTKWDVSVIQRRWVERYTFFVCVFSCCWGRGNHSRL